MGSKHKGDTASGPSSTPQGLLDQALPGLDNLQHLARIAGLAQQTVMERATAMLDSQPVGQETLMNAMEKIALIQAESAQKGMAVWQDMLTAMAAGGTAPSRDAARDPRFKDERWYDNPAFSMIRQSYLLMSDTLMRTVESVEGLEPRQKEQLRFAMRTMIEASSPANSPLTNPQVMQRTIETNGQNLLTGLERMLSDIERGQLSQTDSAAFEVGRNIAVTPGKVVAETPLFQLIQYSPTTESVYETPLVIFPPWINRFYILDLSPEKSFVRWAVEQGLTVFMVSWKSADASMADLTWEDYIVDGQVAAIDMVRDLLDVPSVHTIGYCVAGTTLAASLSWLAAKGRQDIVKSATFFTAQVDFAEAGDLTLFIDDQHLQLVERVMTDGYLDGRYLALTFNLLRGNDLIWSYVVNNYLMGEDYAPFDLLYWNGDSTNLPGKWLKAYLTELYRDNRLVQPESLSVAGAPLDLRRVTVPAYIQAGIEDHIAPARSVWKLMHHFTGPRRFLLAGSGHIAGVVNPPSKNKYQYWTCDDAVHGLDQFREAAVETKGSWWPDWIRWIDSLAPEKVPARKARKPGKGKFPALEDAPGRYVRMR